MRNSHDAATVADSLSTIEKTAISIRDNGRLSTQLPMLDASILSGQASVMVGSVVTILERCVIRGQKLSRKESRDLLKTLAAAQANIDRVTAMCERRDRVPRSDHVAYELERCVRDSRKAIESIIGEPLPSGIGVNLLATGHVIIDDESDHSDLVPF